MIPLAVSPEKPLPEIAPGIYMSISSLLARVTIRYIQREARQTAVEGFSHMKSCDSQSSRQVKQPEFITCY